MRSSDRSVARLGAAAGLMVALTTPSVGAQDGVSAALMVRAVRGTFGAETRSHIVYVPAVVRVDAGRLEVSGSFPFVSIDQGTVALSQGGFVPMQGSLTSSPTTGMSMSGASAARMGGMMGGTSAGVTPSNRAAFMQSGFGDVVGSIGYRIVERPASGLQVALTGRVKLPTASASRGLGTGKTDAGATAAVRRQFDDGWMYAETGYVFVGDPAGVELRNTVLWMAGGGWRLGGRVYLLASAFGNTAILPQFGAPAEVGAGVGWQIADHLNLTVMPSAGLSRASPSYGVTLGLSSRMWRRDKF